MKLSQGQVVIKYFNYVYIYMLIVLILLRVKRDNIRLGLLATFSLSEGHKKEISILNIISNDVKVIDT